MLEKLDSQVVPRTMSRANEIVSRLARYYPHQKRASCRAACAQLFGFETWEDLEMACKRKHTAGDFDEEVENLRERRKTQARILCWHLGYVHPDEPCDKPQFNRSAPPSSIESLLAAEARVEMARKRYQQLLARILIAEIQPTAFEPASGKGAELLASASRGTVAAMPLYLARWWTVTFPKQLEVAQCLSSFSIDENSRADLLTFGQYWGELCMCYADSIGWQFAMGTACLLAERYADLSLPYLPEARELCSLSASERIEANAEERITELFLAKMGEYLSVYPRDDFERVAMAQPGAFFKDADFVLKVFADPKSTKGTWK